MKTKIIKRNEYYYIFVKKGFFSPWRILMNSNSKGDWECRQYVKGRAMQIVERIKEQGFGNNYFLGKSRLAWMMEDR